MRPLVTGVHLPYAASGKRTDRLLVLLRTVNARGAVSVEDLCGEVGVSAATARRDLAVLEARGLLVRTHGGAVPHACHDEVPVHLRDVEAHEAKRLIALRAVEVIPTGRHAVALSGGTTTMEVARLLARRPRLTLVTNAVTIALELTPRPDLEIIFTGGIVRSASLETVGVLAETTFDAVDVGTAVLGVDGISVRGGATTHDEVEARANSAMARRAQRVVVVCDGSKVGRTTSARVVDATAVDVVVTDTSADATELDRLRALGVTVHVVELRR